MQPLNGHSKLLRIFVGETDKYEHSPLYEAILYKAKESSMAGCTVIKGVLSYGTSSVIHTSKLIDISQDLPIIIEIIDTEEKIRAFATVANQLLEKSGGGGIITIEAVEVIHHRPKNL